MSASIELHAYMDLSELFRKRGWQNPHPFGVDHEASGPELLRMLDIAPGQVEVIFVKGKAHAADIAVIRPGDRVALVPPGVPGPHRFLLGFKNR